jgi:hypothetical protein
LYEPGSLRPLSLQSDLIPATSPIKNFIKVEILQLSLIKLTVMKRVFTWLLFFCIGSGPAISSTIPSSDLIIPVDKKIPNEVLLKKISSLKIKDLQRLTGRKFSLKEKIGFLLLKKRLKQKLHKASGEGKTAFILGITGLALLVVGIFVPVVLLGSLVTSIIAIVMGTNADPSDSYGRSGKLLGWITLGLLGILLILALIAWVTFWNSIF